MIADKFALDTKHVETRDEITVLAGLTIFLVFYFLPEFPSIGGDNGKLVKLTTQGRATLGLVLAGGVWLAFSSIPMGVIGLIIGALQAIFLLRPSEKVFHDYMDPAVFFTIGVLIMGIAPVKSGLIRRIALFLLSLTKGNTIQLYIVTALLSALLCHFTINSVVAATLFPILWAVHLSFALESKTTKFGKGLFYALAFFCGIGSVATLFGSPRGIMALSILNKTSRLNLSFLEFSYYMIPVIWFIIFLTLSIMIALFRPERDGIVGFRDQINSLLKELGPVSRDEIVTLTITLLALILLLFQSYIPYLGAMDKAALLLVSVLSLFIFRVLDLSDLELISVNLILIVGGSLSITYCLIETGAAVWSATIIAKLFMNFHPIVFIMFFSVIIFLLSNVIVNVFILSVLLPVGIISAKIMAFSPLIIVFSSLISSGILFISVHSLAGNLISYNSGQFSEYEFTRIGSFFSAIIFISLIIALLIIWPYLGLIN